MSKKMIKYQKIRFISWSLLAILLIPAGLWAEESVNNPVPTLPDPSVEYDSVLVNAPHNARHDAYRDVSRVKWAACGCVGIYFGAAASLLFVPSPRIERLLGKSPEYVLIYTRAYKKAMRGQQFKWAALGCATTTCLATTFMIAAASEDAFLDCGPFITCGLNDDCQAIADNMNACLETGQDCGETTNRCGNTISDCDLGCSPDCSTPDCSPDCNSPDCNTPSCGGSDSNCGSSDSNCGGSSGNCGTRTATANQEYPLQ